MHGFFACTCEVSYSYSLAASTALGVTILQSQFFSKPVYGYQP